MDRSTYFFSLILTFKILHPLECGVLEPKAFSTIDAPNLNTEARDSYLTKGENEPMHDALKNKSTVSIPTKESTISPGRVYSTPETCCLRRYLKIESSRISVSKTEDDKSEKVTNYTSIGTDKGKGEHTSVVLEKSIQNSVSELRDRVRRDDEDEDQPDSSNSNVSTWDNASDSDEELVMEDSSRDKDNDNENMHEETEDSWNKKSSEDWSGRVAPGGTGSTDVEVREVRNARVSKGVLEEIRDGNRFYSPWYREPSLDRRYWSSNERENRRNFIRIPIFPGK